MKYWQKSYKITKNKFLLLFWNYN